MGFSHTSEMESAIGARIRFMELQKENAELKQVLDLQLGQVEQYQEEILRENEQLEMENLELQKKLQEQEEILKKVGNNRMLLERKIDLITKGLQEAQLFFTGLELEIDNNVGVLEETAAISMLSPDLPVSSNRVNLSGSNLDLHIPVSQSAAISSGDSVWAQFPTPISDTTRAVGFQDELLASSTLETRKDPNAFPLFPLFQLPSSSSSSSNSTGKRKHAIDRSRGHPGFYCVCGHRGISKMGLTQHINYRNSKDANDFRFPCTEKNCGQRFFETSHLRSHMKSIHGLVYTKSNGCGRCGQTFSTRSQLWVHIRNTHTKLATQRMHGKDMDKADADANVKNVGVSKETDAMSIPMPSSDLPVSSKRVALSGSNLVLHIPASQSADSDSDNTPSSGFQDEQTTKAVAQLILETHQNPNTVASFPLFQLPSSSSSASNSTGKRKHAIDSGKQRPGFFHCICGTPSASKQRLMRHIEYNNCRDQGKFQFLCEEMHCGQRFFETNALRIHMKTVHDLVYTGMNGCRRCGQTFATLKKLFGHVRTVHKAPSETKIEIEKSNGKRNVEKSKAPSTVQHGKDVTRADASGCNHFCLCGSKFSSIVRLRSHLHYYSSDIVFPCQVCGIRARRPSDLRSHMKVKHNMSYTSGGRKVCRKCGKIFESLKALVKHHRESHDTYPVPKSMETKPI